MQDPYLPFPDEALISPRLAPPVHGLGLSEARAEEDILALADPDDTDGDGIRGKPNWVLDVVTNDMALGRFGWKAEQPSAAQQAADAAHNDMGLTNWYFSQESCEGQPNCENGLQSEDDVDEETVDLFAFHFQTLAVPAQPNVFDPQVSEGRALFQEINGNSCHTPKHITGTHSIAEVSNQTIYPYTDMLLHDMGEELSDNRPSFDAEGNEWRTPPLWGLGWTQIVNPNATFLHDGRAKTLTEAILWHGGEAESSKQAFKALSSAEREALVSFLRSL